VIFRDTDCTPARDRPGLLRNSHGRTVHLRRRLQGEPQPPVRVPRRPGPRPGRGLARPSPRGGRRGPSDPGPGSVPVTHSGHRPGTGRLPEVQLQRQVMSQVCRTRGTPAAGRRRLHLTGRQPQAWQVARSRHAGSRGLAWLVLVPQCGRCRSHGAQARASPGHGGLTVYSGSGGLAAAELSDRTGPSRLTG
jgi:hypothetical protein